MFDSYCLPNQPYPEFEPPRPELEDIAAAVIEYLNVEPRQVYSKRRDQLTAYARHLVMFLAKTFGKHRVKEIGLHFQKDHTTVCHGVRCIEDQISIGNLTVRADVDLLLARLRG